MRNDHVMPGGKWLTIPAPRKLAQLDQAITGGINGDDGGNWFPAKPIGIGGGGLQLTIADPAFTGGVRTGRGYTAASKPRIEIEGSAYPVFVDPQARRIMINPTTDLRKSEATAFTYDRNGSLVSPGAGLANFINVPQLRMHNGATIASVVLRWQVTTKPAALPLGGISEQFGILRLKKDYAGYPTAASYTAFLHTDVAPVGAGVGYAGGLGYRVYSTVEAIWNGGLTKSLVFVPHQNSAIDTSLYSYAIYLVLKDIAVMHPIEVNLSGIAKMGHE